MTTKPKGYERVLVNGRRYMVCAECRLPLTMGYDPCYPVPEPDMPNPDHKQSVCGSCYKIQFHRIYPNQPIPDLPDNYLGEAPEPVPHGIIEAPGDYADEYAVWEAAIEASKLSNGGETVLVAYQRLSGANPPDVTLTGPGGDDFGDTYAVVE